jgi:hypothetical protein
MRNDLTRSTVVSFLAVTVVGWVLSGGARAADANTLRYGIDDEQNFNRLPQVIAQREGLAAPDMNAVRAAISLLGEYDVLNQPLPAAERFVDPTYAKAAGL